jgi:Protein of unknown function (DUF3309)
VELDQSIRDRRVEIVVTRNSQEPCSAGRPLGPKPDALQTITQPIWACLLRKQAALNDPFRERRLCRNGRLMGLLLLVILVLLLVGGLPNWGHSRSWGYGPSGVLGLVLVVFVVLIFMDVVNFSRF